MAMSKVSDDAANVSHPLAVADSTGLTNVHRIAILATSQSFAIPTKWQGRFVTLFNDSTSDLQYAFSTGAAGQALVQDQAAAIGTGHAAAGATLEAGESRAGKVRIGATFLNFIGSAASGYLEVEVSQSAN